ncbi:MAG: hypothetical protein PVF83_00620 [Anaerolineales bacterium]
MASDVPTLMGKRIRFPEGPIPIYPLAFAVYPILALAAANAANTLLQSALWALGVSVLGTLVLWGIVRLAVRNWYTSAGMMAILLILFYAYGHMSGLLFKEGDRTVLLSIVWGALLIGGGWWVVRHPTHMKSLTMPLNVVGVFLLVFPLYTLGSFYIKAQFSPSKLSEVTLSQASPVNASDLPAGDLPDVYYIIFDAYARADVLAEIYHYDNQPTLDRLRELGFYIAGESHSNYNQTFLSIPSSLNMAYINDIMDVGPDTPYDHDRHSKLIRKNEVDCILSEWGYELVSFSSGHGLTAIVTADHYLHPTEEVESNSVSSILFLGKTLPLTSFEALLLETTALQPILPDLYQSVSEPPKFQNHRQRVLYAFEHMADFADAEGNYFVFAHIISPHPPFVFEEDGEPKLHTEAYSIADGTHFVGRKASRGEYISGYRNQLTYVNTLLIEMVEEILEKSETPPVIILQADHGPGAYFDWHSLEKTNQKERMSIFNAYYFPGGDEGMLYPSITPVNTFRVVLNRYFDQDFPLLEDHMFFSDWSTPYDFIEITEELSE